MTNTLHAHVSTSQSDCDGPTYDSWVVVMNDDEIAESRKEFNDFSDIHFMNRVFAGMAGPYAVSHMTVEVTESGFEWNEATDEGYRAGEVRWCTDDCDTNERSHRDVFAERMGY